MCLSKICIRCSTNNLAIVCKVCVPKGTAEIHKLWPLDFWHDQTKLGKLRLIHFVWAIFVSSIFGQDLHIYYAVHICLPCEMVNRFIRYYTGALIMSTYSDNNNTQKCCLSSRVICFRYLLFCCFWYCRFAHPRPCRVFFSLFSLFVKFCSSFSS